MEDKSLSTALGPGPSCLPIERLARYADGLLSDDERRADAAHLAACAHCETELALLQSFASGAVRDEESAIVDAGAAQLRRRESEILGPLRDHQRETSRTWWSLSSWRPALTLAVLLLSIGGSYYLLNPTAPRLPTDVGTGQDAIRSLGITGLEPDGDQMAVPNRLRWDPVAGASRYRVRLTEVDRNEIWSGESAGTSIELPTAVQARLSPAKTLVWQVTAYDASNAAIAESDARRFRLKP